MITVVHFHKWPLIKSSDGVRWLFDQLFFIYHSIFTRHFEDYHDNIVLYVQKNWFYHDTMSTNYGTSGTFLSESEVNACLRQIHI